MVHCTLCPSVMTPRSLCRPVRANAASGSFRNTTENSRRFRSKILDRQFGVLILAVELGGEFAFVEAEDLGIVLGDHRLHAG